MLGAEASATPESLNDVLVDPEFGRFIIVQWVRLRDLPVKTVIVPEAHLLPDNRKVPQEHETGQMGVL